MLKSIVRRCEDYWFDGTRRVATSRVTELTNLHLAGERRDAFMYLPSRPRNVRALLQALPLSNPRDYTFIDLGSGAGRVLFIAAEFPFRQIVGIELAAELHQLAQENIRRFSRRRQCPGITSVHVSAADYEFPNENLVLFLFNPFGPAVLKEVVGNLEDSIRQHPRNVVMALLYPEHKQVVEDCATRLRLLRATPRHAIFVTSC